MHQFIKTIADRERERD